jgi:hypothetical protein
MKLSIVLTALAFLICLALKAQTPATATITPAHVKAAEDLLIASGAGELLKANISTMVKQASANVPDDKKAKFTEIVTAFMNKYMNWDMLKDQMAAMYAQEFTLKELKDLAAFYQSPLGKKLNLKQPVLFQKGAQLGQQAVAAHQSELQQTLQEAFKSE